MNICPFSLLQVCSDRSILNRSRAVQGFTLIESLVGILLTLILTSTAMQALVMATAFKVRAQEYSEATLWIQQDLESLKAEASRLSASVNASICTAEVATDGYADRLRDRLYDIGSGYSPTGSQSSLNNRFQIVKPSSIGQRPYTVNRIVTLSNQRPFNVLQVSYTVIRNFDNAPTTPVATLYTEVIPDAFFSCS